jgi:hypothetical protein
LFGGVGVCVLVGEPFTFFSFSSFFMSFLLFLFFYITHTNIFKVCVCGIIMGTKQQRIFKVDWIKARIEAANKSGQTVDKEKLLAEWAYSFGSTRRTALEILKQLEVLGKAIVKENKIWTPEAWEAEKILNRASFNDKELPEVDEKNAK